MRVLADQPLAPLLEGVPMFLGAPVGGGYGGLPA